MQRRVVLVTNAPVPYREPVHELVSRRLGGRYHVLYAHAREPNRLWNLDDGAGYERSYLRERYVQYRDRFIHINPDVWGALDRLDPDVVITGGFNPTFLLAFAWTLRRGRRHVPFSDGWLKSEAALSFVHVGLRRYVYRRSAAFIGASQHTLELYRRYGAADALLFQSHLCADNERYAQVLDAPKEYDVTFSGQIVDRKMPLFFAEVAALLRERKPDLKVLVLGDGPDRGALLEALARARVQTHYAGFVSQEELPRYYASSRLLLFPTRQEPWGVVANEAAAAGIPVITCALAGVAGELIVHDHNGYVLPLSSEVWADHSLRLLEDEVLWARFSRNALAQAQRYTYGRAAAGIVDAVECARSRAWAR